MDLVAAKCCRPRGRANVDRKEATGLSGSESVVNVYTGLYLVYTLYCPQSLLGPRASMDLT